MKERILYLLGTIAISILFIVVGILVAAIGLNFAKATTDTFYESIRNILGFVLMFFGLIAALGGPIITLTSRH